MLEEDPERADGHEFELERSLITEHLHDLEMNRYPQISKKLGRPIEDIKAAVKRLAGCNRIPASRSAAKTRPPVTPDAIIYYDEENDSYEIEMANDPAPNLFISRHVPQDAQGPRRRTRKPANFWPTTSAMPAG